MKPPLFITARFRTGSTMLWNVFRQLPEARAYYEPLHDRIPDFLEFPIQPDKSHLFVKSYFDEYKDAPNAVDLHQSDFANHRLFLESEDQYPQLNAYIQALVKSVPFKKTAVLQFNRIDFRLAWIKQNFPNARLLHLTRNPRDQWYSTISSLNNINIDSSIDIDAYDLATWARDLYKQFPFLASPQIRHPYQRFYFIWKLSYLAGQRLANLSVAYEELLAEPEKYLVQILNLANLYSAENLEACLKLVEPKPEHAWVKDKNDAWFSDMEESCEAALDELGLNENFALKPLSEIQENSPKYQALLTDPENDRWATKSFKQALSLGRGDIYKTDHHYQNVVAELGRVRAEYEVAVAECTNLRSELDELSNNKERPCPGCDEIRAKLDEKNSECNNLRIQIDQLFVERENLQTQFNDVSTEKEHLRGDRDSIRAELGGVRAELGGMIIERAQLRAEHNNISDHYQHTLNEVARLRAELEGVITERSQLRAEHNNLSDQYQNTLNGVVRLRAEIDKIVLDKSNLQSALNIHEVELARLSGENLQLYRDITNCDLELSKNKIELKSVYASTSWRITSPIRFIKTVLTAVINFPKQAIKAVLASFVRFFRAHPGLKSKFVHFFAKFPALDNLVLQLSRKVVKGPFVESVPEIGLEPLVVEQALNPSGSAGDEETMSEDEKYFMDLFQRELARRQSQKRGDME